ncbi:molybdopterin-dependent oxidoreductase alpha subunit [Haloactinospora alba]|uniref:Molybdopterin-dependent oxidoreductase alpha subunit n=1 Tax=Haloactinospora alba TaxID=405555 RepID=A0A543NIC6_9ACTN|nr:FdhF/YdeP family oxidoreductase [Haloactinospora alba]TQN31597.1 molybdopterin-dependent oxidoreductase alpha subunit [Haloactinospora alba]
MSPAPGNDPRQDNPRVSSPEDTAVGLPAIANSLRVTGESSGAKRGLLTLLNVNKKRGFDCPGCAWPEPDPRHPVEFCENGAKHIAEESTRRKLTPDFFSRYSVSELAECSGYWLGQQGRITHPMYLEEGAQHYVPIGWDEAFDLLAEELSALDSPDGAAFYTSGRTSNEAAFLYQLFARKFGTNNLPDCSNMCHESSSSALDETLGIGKGSVLLDDIYQADLLIVAGQNPGTNHPRMLTALEKAKRSGTRIITVNPLPEAGMQRFKNPQSPRGIIGPGTQLTDLFLQTRVGGDLALFSAFNRLLLQTAEHSPDAIDREFIDTHTHGFDEFARSILEEDEETFWERVLHATGVPREDIEETVAMVLASRRIVVCWAMGITQHRHAVPTIREFVNFLLLRGNIGRTGAGVCPVRGHSNVQGDRTMGIFDRPGKAFLDSLGAEFSFDPPRHHGLDTVETIRAMRDGKVGVFLAMGGNFVSATPDTRATEEAVRQCRLTAHVSTKLNRSHVIPGARSLILPALSRSDHDVQETGEQFVTVENSMGVVHGSSGTVEPLSPEMRSEVDIVASLARRVLGRDDSVPWEEFVADYDRIRDRIEQVIPGFSNFNERVRRPDGFTLPHAPRDKRAFPTHTGKANFTVNAATAPEAPEGKLLLQTLRSHDQFNTTIYGNSDRYRGIHDGRRVVFVNPDDAWELDLADGSYADLVSEFDDGVERRAPHFRVVHYPTARGCAAAYYPETNVLVPLDSTADISNTPTSKSIVVRFETDSGDYAAV